MANKDCVCNVVHDGPCKEHVIRDCISYDNRPKKAATLDDILDALNRIEGAIYELKRSNEGFAG